MERLTLMPWLVALIAGVMALPPTNIFKICAWNAGTMRVDPWRVRSAAAVQRVSAGLRTWLTRLFTGRRLAFACLAMLLAILVAHLSAHAHGALWAITVPIATLREKRAELLQAASAMKGPDGQLKDDATRAAFDAKMTEVEQIDEQIRTAEAVPAPALDDVATRKAATDAERARVLAIQEAVRFANLEDAFATDLVGRGVTLEGARAAIFEKMKAKSDENPTRTGIAAGEDAHDKFMRGAENWLFVKAGVADIVAKFRKVERSTIDPGEFRGFSLLELARESLERAGQSARGLSKMELVSKAFTVRGITQSTSDFAVMLENVMHKVLQAAYAVQPDTWRQFCDTGTVSDFRAQNIYRLGSFGALDSLGENGEFKNKAITDAEKATITAGTKGNIINISRQAIVNDDMGGFGRLVMGLGRAAALSIEVDVYALLAQNAGLGPTMGDGLTLFHATHGNIGTGAAIAAAALDADRVAMASQKDKDGNDYIDLRPAVLVVPVGLGGVAKVINGSQYDPDTVANKAQMKPNIVVGLFRFIVDTPRVSGTRRYLFADPAIAPTIQVAFLEGQSEPVLETQDGWRTDGAEMKVRFDYGVAAIDYRGAVTNAGQ